MNTHTHCIICSNSSSIHSEYTEPFFWWCNALHILTRKQQIRKKSATSAYYLNPSADHLFLQLPHNQDYFFCFWGSTEVLLPVFITPTSLTICPLFPQKCKFASRWFLTYGTPSELVPKVTIFWPFKCFLKAHSYSDTYKNQLSNICQIETKWGWSVS